MHDIWNPWHGCIKKSEGCQNCYMYFLDRQRGGRGEHIYKVKIILTILCKKTKTAAIRSKAENSCAYV